ncbi:UNVERIFIED_CONTAM: hypothetical protein ACS92_02385 [Bacillus cereus]
MCPAVANKFPPVDANASRLIQDCIAKTTHFQRAQKNQLNDQGPRFEVRERLSSDAPLQRDYRTSLSEICANCKSKSANHRVDQRNEG